MLQKLIDSIQGERETDIKIKKVLQGMYDVIASRDATTIINDESIDDDELRAELTELYEKNEKLEEENDNLRAIVTDMDEADSELRAEVTEITDETEIDQGSN
jgi:predicted RNase H-like nuclease (RuvC/YqgF family)